MNDPQNDPDHKVHRTPVYLVIEECTDGDARYIKHLIESGNYDLRTIPAVGPVLSLEFD